MSCDFINLANVGVRALSPYQPGKPVEDLQRELGLKEIIKLASNENPLGPSPKVLVEIERCAKELTRYPDGNAFRLKTSLSQHLQVEREQITLGNGSNDVLELIARAFADSESEIIFSEYAFAVYPIVTQAIGAKAVVTSAKDWVHDLPAMLQAMTNRTKIIFLANPNNPTGTWFTESELTAFLDQTPENVLVVLDEAYFEYLQEADYPNGIRLLQKYSNLIVTRTFSKAYGLAGVRVGYAVSHPDVADLLNRVRQPFNVNCLAQEAAIAALSDSEYLNRSVALNKEGLKLITGAFSDKGFKFIPSVGNFISVDVGRPAGIIYDALLKKGVIVRPVANYGMPNHLRVSVGLQEENEAFLSAFSQVLG